MKRFFSLTVLVIAIVALAAGCSKDNDNPVGGNGNNNNSNAAMTSKIDGAAWKSVAAEAAIEAEEFDMLGVQGDSSASLSLQFTIENFHGKGTYELDGIDNTAFIIDLARGGDMTIYGVAGSESQSGGELVVTEVTSTMVKGTFRFTAENTLGTKTKSVTDGVFSVKLN